MEATIGVKNIKFGDYRIEFYTLGSALCSKLFRKLKGSNRKREEKLLENYRHKSESSRIEYAKKKVDFVKKITDEKAAEKNQRNEAIKSFVNPYKVGDLFYDSWGYDQTNIDFYKIVDLKPRSVVLVRLGHIKVKDMGFMCEMVRPDVDREIGERFNRPIKFSRDGKTTRFNGHESYRGAISPYTRGENGVYQSHYA